MPTRSSPRPASAGSAIRSRSASSPGSGSSSRRSPKRTGPRSPIGSQAVPTWPRPRTPPFAQEKDAVPVRLIVRRVRPTPGSQLAAFVLYDYHAFITDRVGDTLTLEADHRRHAEIENAIRDLKYGVGLNHLPSGKFGANGAWLAVQVIAHNLARWTARIGLGEGIVTTKTLRRRLFGLAGRLTRSARRVRLHLPARWPWAVGWSTALARLRAIPPASTASGRWRPCSHRSARSVHSTRGPGVRRGPG